VVFGVRLLRARNEVWFSADSVVAVKASECCLELVTEPWDVVGDHFADDLGVDVEVGVGGSVKGFAV
jgi:hypothetical protein